MSNRSRVGPSILFPALFPAVLILLSAAPTRAADVALLIGEKDYPDSCPSADLPKAPDDVARMKTALSTAEWTIVDRIDRTKAQVLELIADHKPETGKFLFYFTGHGSDVTEGDLITTDCKKITPTELLEALGDARTRTFLILDSCLSGEFVKRVNDASDPTCTLSATEPSRAQCAHEEVFTKCLTEGMAHGATDGNGDGTIVMDELKNYVYSNCNTEQQTAYWDGGCKEWVMSKLLLTPTELRSWGAIKTLYPR